MYSFFNFSKGEWSAVILITIVLISTLIFKKAYPERHSPEPLPAHYSDQIAHFIEQQTQLADSIKLSYAKSNFYNTSNKKDSSYKAKKFTSGIIPDDSIKRVPRSPGYAIVKVELNRCDTADITKIPLFGSKRAAKIIEYRELLGGFHNLMQLHEIFVIQNITIEHIEKYFSIDTVAVKKLPINTIEYRDLIKHPYFDVYLTKTIMQYRQKHGNIRDMEHFREITHAYQELIDNLKPYLTFN